MFFLSNKVEAKSYTLIHNAFFEQIMPYVDSKYIKIYLYSYYLANNIDKVGVKTIQDIAKELNIEYLEVLEAFDYLENCNLIRKHYTQNSSSDNYSIEFLKIDHYKTNDDTSYEQEYVTSKNENLRNMYDKIEEIIKIHLSAYDIKKIDTIIKNNDLSYDVVIEAFKFTYYNKKASSVNDALKTIKSWIQDGVFNTSDLDGHLLHINERYATHTKILKYFGEYRLPTKPEIKNMDKWMDEYCFSVEVIEKAIDETLKIKSPNFKYLDGILNKWHEAYKTYNKIIKPNDEPYINYKSDIVSLCGLSNTGEKDDKLLMFMYKNYPKETIISAINYIFNAKKKKSLDSVEELFEFLTGSSYNDKAGKETVISFGNITIKQMQEVWERSNKGNNSVKDSYQKKNTKYKNTSKKSTQKDSDISDVELEDIILSKNDLGEF